MSMFDMLFAKSLSSGSGGGSSLPAVTSADNGDLLGVVEGEWGKVDPPAGGETFTVTLTNESDTWTADKTITEIIEASEAGKNCVAVGEFTGESGAEYTLPLMMVVSQYNVVSFSGAYYESGPEIVNVMGVVDDGTDIWEVEKKSAAELPVVTSADDGSLLGVFGGTWAKVANKSPMVVEGTVTNDTTVTITTALADIQAAYNAGRTVYLQLNTIPIRLSLVSCYIDDGKITIKFSHVSYDSSAPMLVDVTFAGEQTAVLSTFILGTVTE